mgnify:CR=1 FL=1
MVPPLNRAVAWLKWWSGRIIILAIGLAPASCHYEITGPLLWAHQIGYAFEAWLVMWIIGIAFAIGAIWLCLQE